MKRQKFDPKNLPEEGSLGILALGDIGFEAWRAAKGHIRNNKSLLHDHENDAKEE